MYRDERDKSCIWPISRIICWIFVGLNTAGDNQGLSNPRHFFNSLNLKLRDFVLLLPFASGTA